jgi:hypothetical protein
MLGCDIASNSAFSWKNLAWIVVICQLVPNIHRPAVLSDDGGNNTPSTSGGRERGRLEIYIKKSTGTVYSVRNRRCFALHRTPAQHAGVRLPES